MIQKALHIDELPGRRFMASKPNEEAHVHNHGTLFKCPKNWHIGAHHALPMNVYIWVYLNKFTIKWFFPISSEYRRFL